jgi:hypothetical protein
MLQRKGNQYGMKMKENIKVQKNNFKSTQVNLSNI